MINKIIFFYTEYDKDTRSLQYVQKVIIISQNIKSLKGFNLLGVRIYFFKLILNDESTEKGGHITIYFI